MKEKLIKGKCLSILLKTITNLLLQGKKDRWFVKFMNIEESKWVSMIVVNIKIDMNLAVELSVVNVEASSVGKRFI